MTVGPTSLLDTITDVLDDVATTENLNSGGGSYSIVEGLWGEPIVRLSWFDDDDVGRNILVHLEGDSSGLDLGSTTVELDTGDEPTELRIEGHAWLDEQLEPLTGDVPPTFERHWSHVHGEQVDTDSDELENRLEDEIQAVYNRVAAYPTERPFDETTPLDLRESDRRLLANQW